MQVIPGASGQVGSARVRTEAVLSGKAANRDPAAKIEKAKTTIIDFLRETLAEKEEHAYAV